MAYQPTIEDEKALRADLKTYLQTIASPNLGNIHTRRRSVSNRADFVAKFGALVESVPAQKLIRYVDIEFVRYENSPDEGFDDCPVQIYTYNFHIFQEFFDGTDDANANDDFIDSLLKLNAKFLSKQEFDAGDYLAKSGGVGITMPEFLQLGNDGFTDATGFFADVQTKLYLYNQPGV